MNTNSDLVGLKFIRLQKSNIVCCNERQTQFNRQLNRARDMTPTDRQLLRDQEARPVLQRMRQLIDSEAAGKVRVVRG